MNRKDFIINCSFACIGATGLATVLQSCQTSNYFAKSTLSNNKIIIKKTEFTINEDGLQGNRKYVLLKTNYFHFPICVYFINENNYSALLMECTHRGCELTPSDNYLICPCHGSEFSNKGIVQNPPADQNLKTFQITTDNENIYLQL